MKIRIYKEKNKPMADPLPETSEVVAERHRRKDERAADTAAILAGTGFALAVGWVVVISTMQVLGQYRYQTAQAALMREQLKAQRAYTAAYGGK